MPMFADRSQKRWLYQMSACLSLFLLANCSTNEDKKDGSSTNRLRGVAKASEVVTKKRPNIIVILTDQERYPMHWPEGWAEKNLKATERLKKNGLSFQRAYTAACQCTP